MANASTQSQRLHYLDALRSLAMVSGIVTHTAIFVFPKPEVLWPIHDPAATGDQFYRIVFDSIQGFRMPLFFMLSGLFSALLWQRRGLRGLAMHRLKRVGLPFIIACFTILPLGVWLLATISGGKEPYNFPPWVYPLIWLFGSLGHLWFLWHLLLMVSCFAIVVLLGIQFRHPLVWWLTIPLTVAISLVMKQPVFGPDFGNTIIPNATAIGYHLCFFAFGAFFYQKGITVRRWWAVAILPAAVAYYVGSRLIREYQALFDAAPAPAFLFEHELTLLAAPIEVAYAWLMVFGMMGLFRWLAARESFMWRYLSDASYWMYLSHVFLVVLGQWLVIDWPIHYHWKFLLVLIGATLGVLATYQLFVRYTFIGNLLNGPRTRRRSQPSSQPA